MNLLKIRDNVALLFPYRDCILARAELRAWFKLGHMARGHKVNGKGTK
jgi:hypothetical protein